MDLKKWDALVLAEDEDVIAEDDLLQDVTAATSSLFRCKHKADELFAEAKIEQSLSLYLQVLQRLVDLGHQKDQLLSLLDLRVLCQLNAACCFMEMNEWKQCIEMCDSFLKVACDLKEPVCSAEKRARGLYFKTHSLLELFRSNPRESILLEAENCCQELKILIEKTEQFTDQSIKCKIGALIQRINLQRSHATENHEIDTLRSERVLSDAECTFDGLHHNDSLHMTNSNKQIEAMFHEASRLYNNNQPVGAIRILRRAMDVIKEDGEDIRPETIVCLQSMGDCFYKLQEYDEAISMYERAAGFVEVDEMESITAVCQARSLQLKAGNAAVKSSSHQNARLTPESELTRASTFFNSAVVGLPEGKAEREKYFEEQGHSPVQLQFSMRIEADALRGLAQCLFKNKKYDMAVQKATAAENMFCHLRELYSKDNNQQLSNFKKMFETSVDNSVMLFQITSFSYFYLNEWDKSVQEVNQAIELAFQKVPKYGICHTFSRNEIIVKLLFLKNQVMLQAKCIEVEALEEVWEQVARCADVFASLASNFEAAKLYKLSGEYFMSQSDRAAFHLNDKTMQQSPSQATLRANELFELSAKHMKRSITQQCETVENTGDVTDNHLEEIQRLHKMFISTIKVQFCQGLCADSISHAQRCYESALATNEDYIRSKKTLSLTDCDYATLQQEYHFLQADVSHHLAFTYMRCGKLLYALEEATSAIQQYERLQEAIASEGATDALFRLRQAWGLMAVIRRHRQEFELSSNALAKVKTFESSGHTERKQEEEDLKALEENLDPDNGSSKKSASISAILGNKNTTNDETSELKPQNPRKDFQPIDFNLYLAYFILTTAMAAFIYVLIQFAI